MGLLHDVPHMHHLTFIIDAGCAADKDVAAVAVADGGAALKGDTIFVGGVEVCLGIEVALLLGREAHQGIGAQLYQCFGVGRRASDACGGDEMGIFC